MNCLSVLRILFLISSISSISCQSIHFCQALKDNNWSIGYSLSVPNGTFHRKFVIIKQHYWELEYTPKSSRRKRQEFEEPTDEPFVKGEVYLKDVWGKQSQWLAGDYQLAFAVRHGMPSEEWTKTILALVNTNTQKYEWTLFDRNFGDLSVGSQKQSFDTNFGDFKPDIAYNTYSRQELNSAIFIQQTPSGERFAARIQAFFLSDPTQGLTNETNDPLFRANPRKIVPHSINATASVYKIKGLFGVLKPNSEEGGERMTNASIFLIQYCPTLNRMRTAGEVQCDKPITLNYCIATETDENPITGSMVCHPALVDKQKLVDCSNPDEWSQSLIPESETNPFSNGSQIGSGTDSIEVETKEDDSRPPIDNAIRTDEPNPQESGSGSGGGSSSSVIWIIVIVVVILIILIILIVVCLISRSGGKSKDQEQSETKSVATPSATGTYGSQEAKKGPKSSVSGKPTKLSKASVDTTGSGKGSDKGDKSLSVPSVRSEIK